MSATRTTRILPWQTNSPKVYRNNKCPFLLTRGKNKGTECGTGSINVYCKKHDKYNQLPPYPIEPVNIDPEFITLLEELTNLPPPIEPEEEDSEEERDEAIEGEWVSTQIITPDVFPKKKDSCEDIAGPSTYYPPRDGEMVPTQVIEEDDYDDLGGYLEYRIDYDNYHSKVRRPSYYYSQYERWLEEGDMDLATQYFNKIPQKIIDRKKWINEAITT